MKNVCSNGSVRNHFNTLPKLGNKVFGFEMDHLHSPTRLTNVLPVEPNVLRIRRRENRVYIGCSSVSEMERVVQRDRVVRLGPVR